MSVRIVSLHPVEQDQVKPHHWSVNDNKNFGGNEELKCNFIWKSAQEVYSYLLIYLFNSSLLDFVNC